MKIQKLRFKNLNSLVGEWCLDFSQPAFQEQGIFAITGPTGAGKSTILDAICLALYGQTPRLGNISKNNNEIMSRQTGECFAELVFTTKHGCYRAFWEQSRARKKALANLQLITRELADVGRNQILETKPTLVNSLIIELIGMDFEHFTRAMLLAQGGFAKFLQATPDERSPILEQITGSQIYSEISKKVHEHKVAQEHKLHVLQAELAGMQLLSETELEQLNAELAVLLAEQAQLSTEIAKHENFLRWRHEIRQMEQELQLLMARQRDLDQECDEWQPQAKRLRQGQQAAELKSKIYAQLVSLRNQQRQLMGELHDYDGQLPQLTINHQAAASALAEHQQTYQQFKRDSNEQLQLLQEVRELDSKLAQTQVTLSKLSSNKQELEQRIKQIQARQAATKLELAGVDQHIQQVNTYLTQQRQDGGLVANFSGIEQSLARLEQHMADQESVAAQITLAQTKLEQLQDHEHLIQQQQKSVQRQLEQDQAQLAQLELGQATLANNHSLAELAQQQMRLGSRKQALLTLIETGKKWQATVDELSHIQEEQVHKQSEQVNLQAKHEAVSQQIQVVEQLIASLNRQLILENKVHSLAEERAKLQEQQPCPLCGSLTHPYVNEPLPSITASSEQLAKNEELLHELRHLQTKLSHEQAMLAATLTAQVQQEKLLVTAQASLQQTIKQQAQALELEVAANPTLLLAKAEREEDKLLSDLQHLEEVVAQLHQLSLQVSDLHQQIKDKQQVYTHLINDQVNLKAQSQSLQATIAQHQQNLQQLNNRRLALADSLTQQLAVYGVSLDQDSPALLKEGLARRLDKWQQQQQQLMSLHEQARQLTMYLEKDQVELTSLEQQNAQVSHEHLAQQAVYEQWQAWRRQLFSDRDPQRASELLSEQQDELEQQGQQLQAAETACAQELATTRKLIANYTAKLQPLSHEVSEVEHQFVIGLEEYGFSDEDSFSQALISHEQLLALQQEQEQLHHRQIVLNAEQSRLTLKMHREQEKALTTASQEELQQTISLLTGRLGEINQAIGSLKSQLQQNEQLLIQQATIIRARQQQMHISQRWQQLHSLIGSADGKKFRNFAQGLTFELVVNHANRELQKLSDRYLLVRDGLAPLELNVIDNYQGGDVRTTKNLSGGESFIISLALALGLSKLSSAKVQVDSLFLDEGFGSLDEDSLQLALDALASLHHEGKLIGVISHVAALKDRISLQIEVEPVGGGMSQIRGVGCVWQKL